MAIYIVTGTSRQLGLQHHEVQIFVFKRAKINNYSDLLKGRLEEPYDYFFFIIYHILPVVTSSGSDEIFMLAKNVGPSMTVLRDDVQHFWPAHGQK